MAYPCGAPAEETTVQRPWPPWRMCYRKNTLMLSPESMGMVGIGKIVLLGRVFWSKAELMHYLNTGFKRKKKPKIGMEEPLEKIVGARIVLRYCKLLRGIKVY